MSLGKRVRFEVFKRDGFTCRYCGRTPPAVTLECDHVLAKARGGKDDIENLVTSCFDCNRGKGAVALGVVVPGVNVEAQKERMAQMMAYEEFLGQKRDVESGWLDDLLEYWADKEGQTGESYELDREVEAAVRKFLKKLPRTEIKEAIDIAFDRVPGSHFRRCKFFFGVCWKKIKDLQGVATCT